MGEKLGKILVIGACGQIGSELVGALRVKYGKENVIAAGKVSFHEQELFARKYYRSINVLDREDLEAEIQRQDIDTIFNLAAVLSAKGEKNPQLAFKVNTLGVYNFWRFAENWI